MGKAARGGRARGEEPELYRASHRFARISARKARLVMDMIRGISVDNAITKLQFCDRRAAPMISKVLHSAVANAAQLGGVEPDNLRVHRAYVDEGPTMKRWRPRSMGRAFPRLKRTCHLNVVVRELEQERLSRAKRAGRAGATAETPAAAPETAPPETETSRGETGGDRSPENQPERS